MKCLFCKNEVLPEQTKYYSFNGFQGWCKKCSLPVFYNWLPKKPEEDFTQIVFTQIYSESPFKVKDNTKYYCFTLDYINKRTNLVCCIKEEATLTQDIMQADSILDISPNNFFKKLQTYLVFS